MMRGDAGEALDLRVVPDAGAAGAGAAIRGDGDLLGEDQAEAAGGAGAHEHDVVVAHAPFRRERYMVIGDIAMRLRSVTPFRVKGLNRSGIAARDLGRLSRAT